MDGREFNDKILNPLKRWAPLGEKVDEYGTRLIGHIFKDAPYGYMHELHKAARVEFVSAAELSLGRAFPKQFKEFLLCSNGASFYNPSGIHVFGVSQKDYFPECESKPWRFPIDIVKNNRADWLKIFPDSAIIVGCDDGASTSIVSIGDNGPIIEYDIQEPDDLSLQWVNFDDWLISEFQNLYVEHDDAGNLLEVSATLQ